VILCLAGSLVSAGLKKVFVDMVRNRMVDAIVSTGANIVDQDFFEALGFKHWIADEKLNGLIEQLRRWSEALVTDVEHLEVVAGDVVGSGQDNDAVGALVRRIDHDRAQLADRHRNDREINPTRELGDRISVRNSGNYRTIAGNYGNVAMKAAAQHRIDQALDSITESVHSNALGVQQPPHRSAFGSMLPPLHDPD